VGGLWMTLLAAALAGARAHPMHTAVGELTQVDPQGRVTVQIRVFTDDLEAAVPAAPEPAGADSSLARYLRGSFALSDRSGRPVRLAWAGAERSGDVILLRLRGEVAGGLVGARVTSLVLCDRFPDQVNIVRARYAGRTTTLLFTRGETAKSLP
jgi:hypothetical protein